MRSIYFTLLVFILALPGGFCHASDDDFEDDYEDFGYEIANAKRYTTRTKSQRKFKDTDYFDD